MLYHVVGGSFAACGLLAWHRRPESRAGPLMVVTGLLFFVHGTLGRLHSSFAETIGIAVSNYWIITFAALLVWFPGGRRRWAASERLVIGAFVVAEVVLALVVDAVRRDSPQPRARLAEPAGRERNRQERRARSGSPRRSAWRSFSSARWLKATRPVRRASAPAAAGALTLLFLGGLILQGVFTHEQSPYLVWPTLVGLVLVPVVFLAGVWRMWVARAAVGDLLVDLGSMQRPAAAGRVGESARRSDADPRVLASAVRLVHRQRRPEARASRRR